MRNTRNALPKKGNELHPDARAAWSEKNLSELVAAALNNELGNSHQAVKTVIRWTGASERTVKYWFSGAKRPSGEHLIALSRHSDEVLRVFLIMANRNPATVVTRIVAVRKRLMETVEFIDQNL